MAPFTAIVAPSPQSPTAQLKHRSSLPPCSESPTQCLQVDTKLVSAITRGCHLPHQAFRDTKHFCAHVCMYMRQHLQHVPLPVSLSLAVSCTLSHTFTRVVPCVTSLWLPALFL